MAVANLLRCCGKRCFDYVGRGERNVNVSPAAVAVSPVSRFVTLIGPVTLAQLVTSGVPVIATMRVPKTSTGCATMPPITTVTGSSKP